MLENLNDFCYVYDVYNILKVGILGDLVGFTKVVSFVSTSQVDIS
jgi:hypothetical protein